MWELDYKESWASKNWWFWTVVLEKTFESPLDCKEIQPVCPKGDQSWVFIGRTDWCWSWNSNSLATWCEELTHLKGLWCWERLRAGGEGDNRGWNGLMASQNQCTWVWVNSRSWWWTGRPGMLQSMGLQRVRHDCYWTELNCHRSSKSETHYILYKAGNVWEGHMDYERELMSVTTKQRLVQRVQQNQWSREDWWNELIKAVFQERSTSWAGKIQQVLCSAEIKLDCALESPGIF